MRLPQIARGKKPSGSVIVQFGGLNKDVIIEDGEMRNMKNLSPDKFPYITQRGPRGIVASQYTNITNIKSIKGKLSVIADNIFYYDGYEIKLNETHPKTVVAINNKICIYPDKIVFDLIQEKSRMMDNVCHANGMNEFNVKFTNNALTLEEKVPSVIKNNGWEEFRAGDAIKMYGADNLSYHTDTYIINMVITELAGLRTLVFTFSDNTFPEEEWTTTDTIVLDRTSPNMEHVCEHNNRIWGVAGNIIHGCKLGDPYNWNFFDQGIADNSYALEVGSDGAFTGCVSAVTHILFFKDHLIHKIYGDRPATYQLITHEAFSLEKGAHKSIAVINGVIYFKSQRGIMAYVGDSVANISNVFYNERFTDAVAGTDGTKYYVCMTGEDGVRKLYTYNPQRNVWYIEDEKNISEFTILEKRLLYIESNIDNIYTLSPRTTEETIEEKIEWIAEFGSFSEYKDNKKIISKLLTRINLEAGSEVKVSASFDGGEYKEVTTLKEQVIGAYNLPIIPIRCDRFSIKFEGIGRCDIESITREFRWGSTL